MRRNRKAEITIGGKTTTRNFPKRDQFADELIYFSDCILKGREPEPSGREGLADVRIVRAACESARAGRAIEFPELPRKKGRCRNRKFIGRPTANRKS